MFFRGGRRLFPVGVMRSLPFCLSPVCLLFGGGEGRRFDVWGRLELWWVRLGRGPFWGGSFGETLRAGQGHQEPVYSGEITVRKCEFSEIKEQGAREQRPPIPCAASLLVCCGGLGMRIRIGRKPLRKAI